MDKSLTGASKVDFSNWNALMAILYQRKQINKLIKVNYYLSCNISMTTLLEFCEFYIVRNIDEKNAHFVAYKNGVIK